MILLLVRAHDMRLKESLVGESLTASIASNVFRSPVTDHVCLRHMHLEGALLGEDFATLLAHEANVVSSQIMIVQLQFERERVVADAAFERRIAAMIRRYVMIQHR